MRIFLFFLLQNLKKLKKKIFYPHKIWTKNRRKNRSYKNRTVGRFFLKYWNPALMLKSGGRTIFFGTRNGLFQSHMKEEGRSGPQWDGATPCHPISLLLAEWSWDIYRKISLVRKQHTQSACRFWAWLPDTSIPSSIQWENRSMLE